jgi:serine/threonine protein kinase
MIGEKLGKYTILATLGSGSLGTVYKAEDSAAGSRVALKRVRSLVLYSQDIRERFLQQLLTASEIRHPKLCPLLEIGDDEDDFYVVMPLIEGLTLEKLANHRIVPWQRAVGIALEIGEALSAIHAAGAIHRGLKPANIWIQRNGSILVSDFCLSRFTELEKDGTALHSASKPEYADTLIPLSAIAYMSPEQIRGHQIDHRSDIFSLGAILYELLTGKHPFEARNSLSRISAILEAEPPPLISKLQELPYGLDSVVRKALAKSPEERHPSIQCFMDQLRAISLQFPSPESQAAKRIMVVRNNAPLLAVLLVLFLLIACASAYFYLVALTK